MAPKGKSFWDLATLTWRITCYIFCQNVGTKENFLKIINLYRGNEIAVNSVTGRNLAFENLTIWREELETMRDLLGSLANVPAKDILGVRAPSLKVGRNAQYTVRILNL